MPLKSATTSYLGSSTLSSQSTNFLTSSTLDDIKNPSTLISSTAVLSANADSAESLLLSDSEKILDSKPEKLVEQSDDGSSNRKRRSDDKGDDWVKLIPGACVKGCAFGFYAFSLMSSLINCFGASGRIGNLLGEIFSWIQNTTDSSSFLYFLVNYRCVSNQDKSVTQGLILMMISLFALIPGPIFFGRIIDST